MQVWGWCFDESNYLDTVLNSRTLLVLVPNISGFSCLCILPVRCKNFENLQIPNWNVRPKMGLLPEKIQVAKFFLNHVFFFMFVASFLFSVPVPSGSIATLPKSILPWDFQLAVINRDRIHSWRREPPRSVAQCCSCNKIGRMTYVAPSSTRNAPSRYRWHVSINYGIASDP
jgi:hypothetical protein